MTNFQLKISTDSKKLHNKKLQLQIRNIQMLQRFRLQSKNFLLTNLPSKLVAVLEKLVVNVIYYHSIENVHRMSTFHLYNFFDV